MASGVSPIKVDAETDALVSHAAHFLDRSKKDVVDVAIREYIENHRAEISEGVREVLARLDGTKASAVSLLTGFSKEKLDELGGAGDWSSADLFEVCLFYVDHGRIFYSLRLWKNSRPFTCVLLRGFSGIWGWCSRS